MPITEYSSKPDDQPELGVIKINHTVIAGIVRLAAMKMATASKKRGATV